MNSSTRRSMSTSKMSRRKPRKPRRRCGKKHKGGGNYISRTEICGDTDCIFREHKPNDIFGFKIKNNTIQKESNEKYFIIVEMSDEDKELKIIGIYEENKNEITEEKTYGETNMLKFFYIQDDNSRIKNYLKQHSKNTSGPSLLIVAKEMPTTIATTTTTSPSLSPISTMINTTNSPPAPVTEIYYPCCIENKQYEEGSYKMVFEPQQLSGNEDKARKQLKLRGILFDMTPEDALNYVFVIPKNQNNQKNIEDFKKEMILAEKFEKKKIGPSILKNFEDAQIIPYHFGTGRKKIFSIMGYCDFKYFMGTSYQENSPKLDILFEKCAQLGYIFNDIKHGNICYNKSEETFIFVDFDPKFCIQHSGVDAQNERISKIMKLMFVLNEISQMKRAFDVIETWKKSESFGQKSVAKKYYENVKGMISEARNLLLTRDIVQDIFDDTFDPNKNYRSIKTLYHYVSQQEIKLGGVFSSKDKTDFLEEILNLISTSDEMFKI